VHPFACSAFLLDKFFGVDIFVFLRWKQVSFNPRRFMSGSFLSGLERGRPDPSTALGELRLTP